MIKIEKVKVEKKKVLDLQELEKVTGGYKIESQEEAGISNGPRRDYSIYSMTCTSQYRL